LFDGSASPTSFESRMCRTFEVFEPKGYEMFKAFELFESLDHRRSCSNIVLFRDFNERK